MNKKIDLSEFGTSVPFISRTGIKALKLDTDGICIMMPLEPNINHIGIMYAGALWTLSESMGGAVYQAYLAVEGTFPIVKGLNIKFLRPAATDITCEYKMDPAEASRIVDACEKNGKANFDIALELKDAKGNVVAVTEGFYQVRKGTGL
jgi:acyl-coenzyme A thioesterase PaaI-like protein